jgi:hypothetical protein
VTPPPQSVAANMVQFTLQQCQRCSAYVDGDAYRTSCLLEMPLNQMSRYLAFFSVYTPRLRIWPTFIWLIGRDCGITRDVNVPFAFLGEVRTRDVNVPFTFLGEVRTRDDNVPFTFLGEVLILASKPTAVANSALLSSVPAAPSITPLCMQPNLPPTFSPNAIKATAVTGRRGL